MFNQADRYVYMKIRLDKAEESTPCSISMRYTSLRVRFISNKTSHMFLLGAVMLFPTSARTPFKLMLRKLRMTSLEEASSAPKF